MAENIKMEDLVEEVVPTSETTEEEQVETEAEVETEADETTEPDPLKAELDRVTGKGRTEEEKAAYTFKKQAERLVALGKDPASILGIKPAEVVTEENEDDKPVTLGMLKKIQQESASKTALQLADEITNVTERELVKHHLTNTIKATGNPNEDLRNARALVNSVKNTKIIEEAGRKPAVKNHSSASGADATKKESVVLTPEELQVMRISGLTVQEILDARAGKQFKFGQNK